MGAKLKDDCFIHNNACRCALLIAIVDHLSQAGLIRVALNPLFKHSNGVVSQVCCQCNQICTFISSSYYDSALTLQKSPSASTSILLRKV